MEILVSCHSFDKLRAGPELVEGTASEAKPKNLNVSDFIVTPRLIMYLLH
jgi:hypothetical protein